MGIKKNSDTIELLLLYAASIISVYVFPSLRVPFYLLSLILFFFSEQDHLWLCFMFVLQQTPGYLFMGQYSWVIQLTSRVGIGFPTVFAGVALLKILVKYRGLKYSYFTKAPLLISIYALFLIVISFVIGIDFVTAYWLALLIIGQSLFFTVPLLLSNKSKLIQFIKLAYISMLILTLVQLIDLLLPIRIHALLSVQASELSYELVNDIRYTDRPIRMLYSPFLSLFCITSALFMLYNKRRDYFSRTYLTLVIFMSMSSVIITATRGWIVAYTFIMIVMMFTFNKRAAKTLLFCLLVSVLVYISFPVIQRQINLVWRRVNTMSSLLQGDYTAEGTLSRIVSRGPRVYSKFQESKLVGFGYSAEGREYLDIHVGNYNILLEGGVLGAIVFIVVLGVIVLQLNIYYRLGQLNRSQYYGIMSIFGALLIIHSSSTQFFGYTVVGPRLVSLALIMTFLTRFLNREEVVGSTR